MGMGLVHCTVCLFTFQLLLVLIAPSHEEMARLSSPGWLVTYQDSLLYPVSLVTGPDLKQLH